MADKPDEYYLRLYARRHNNQLGPEEDKELYDWLFELSRAQDIIMYDPLANPPFKRGKA